MAITFTGTVATDFIEGNGASNQYLFAVENSLQSRVKVYLRRVYFFDEHLAAYTAVKARMLSYRATNVIASENVTAYTKGKFDSSQSSDAGVKIWSGATPSYSGISGLSCTPGNRLWEGMPNRMHTIYGRGYGQAINVLPGYATKFPLVLYPGESFIVQSVAAAVDATTINDHFFFNAVWSEEPITMHTVSGTVTLSGTGVVGAKVFVLIADDTSLTHAYLWETVTTGVGGAWSCATIPDEKIAYAYAQNYTGGTYYTAAGAPYVS